MEPNKNNSGKMLRNLLLVIGLPLVLFFGMWAMISNQTAAKKEEQVYSDYIQYFVDNKVEKYTLDLGTGKLMLSLREQYRTDVNKDGKVDDKDVIVYKVPNVAYFLNTVDPIVTQAQQDDDPNNNVSYEWKPVANVSWLYTWLPYLLMMVLVILGVVMMRRSLNGMDGAGKIMGFGKAKIK